MMIVIVEYENGTRIYRMADFAKAYRIPADEGLWKGARHLRYGINSRLFSTESADNPTGREVVEWTIKTANGEFLDRETLVGVPR